MYARKVLCVELRTSRKSKFTNNLSVRIVRFLNNNSAVVHTAYTSTMVAAVNIFARTGGSANA